MKALNGPQRPGKKGLKWVTTSFALLCILHGCGSSTRHKNGSEGSAGGSLPSSAPLQALLTNYMDEQGLIDYNGLEGRTLIKYLRQFICALISTSPLYPISISNVC